MQWTDDRPGAGDTDSVRRSARHLGDAAQETGAVHRAVRGLVDGLTEAAWAGEAADEWRERGRRCLADLGVVVESLDEAEAALRTYATEVEEIADEAELVLRRREMAAADLADATARLAATSASAGTRGLDARRDDARAHQRAADRAMAELADRRRSADARVVAALEAADPGPWMSGSTGPVSGRGAAPSVARAPDPGPFCSIAPERTVAAALPIVFQQLTDWMASRDAQHFVRVGQANPALLNDMLAQALATMGGDLGHALGLLWNGSTSAQGGEVAGMLLRMQVLFKPKSTWDAKPYLKAQLGIEEEDEGHLIQADGTTVYYDVFGNIQYGAMCAMFGLDPVLAIAASNSPGSGDQDEPDDLCILLGYELAEAFPNGLTEAEFRRWFLSDDVQRRLRAMGRVR